MFEKVRSGIRVKGLLQSYNLKGLIRILYGKILQMRPKSNYILSFSFLMMMELITYLYLEVYFGPWFINLLILNHEVLALFQSSPIVNMPFKLITETSHAQHVSCLDNHPLPSLTINPKIY